MVISSILVSPIEPALQNPSAHPLESQFKGNLVAVGPKDLPFNLVSFFFNLKIYPYIKETGKYFLK